MALTHRFITIVIHCHLICQSEAITAQVFESTFLVRTDRPSIFLICETLCYWEVIVTAFFQELWDHYMRESSPLL